MRRFCLMGIASAAALAAASCADPETDPRQFGSDTAAEDADTDPDTDIDADDDTDADADDDTQENQPFLLVAYEWCNEGSCATLDGYGYLLPGIGQLEATTEGDIFPIKFIASEVGGEGEFTSADMASVNVSGLVINFERGR